MAPVNIAQLPDELILSILDQKFPCRQQQTRALATLISVSIMSSEQMLQYRMADSFI